MSKPSEFQVPVSFELLLAGLSDSAVFPAPADLIKKLMEEIDAGDRDAMFSRYTIRLHKEYERVKSKNGIDSQYDSLFELFFIVGYLSGHEEARYLNYMLSPYNKGIARQNFDKHRAKKFFQTIASDLWREHEQEGKETRIGAMCEILHDYLMENVSKLEEADLWDQVPQDPDGLRKTIREVAPKYASKGGRTRVKKR